jgi:hypothetical protein
MGIMDADLADGLQGTLPVGGGSVFPQGPILPLFHIPVVGQFTSNLDLCIFKKARPPLTLSVAAAYSPL